jgi:hypothetical protein
MIDFEAKLVALSLKHTHCMKIFASMFGLPVYNRVKYYYVGLYVKVI